MKKESKWNVPFHQLPNKKKRWKTLIPVFSIQRAGSRHPRDPTRSCEEKPPCTWPFCNVLDSSDTQMNRDYCNSRTILAIQATIQSPKRLSIRFASLASDFESNRDSNCAIRTILTTMVGFAISLHSWAIALMIL